MVLLGITDLGINLPVLVGQLISFTTLLVLLNAFVYKPIMRVLDERRERIREGLSAAEASRERAEEANRQAQAQIEAARREGQNIIAQAQQVSQRLQEEAAARAEATAQNMLARAQADIAAERDIAIQELRKEFANLTIAAAEKVVGRALDREAHRRLIEEALADSSFRAN